MDKDHVIPEDDPDSLIYDDVDYDEPSAAAAASLATSASGNHGTHSP